MIQAEGVPAAGPAADRAVRAARDLLVMQHRVHHVALHVDVRVFRARVGDERDCKQFAVRP